MTLAPLPHSPELGVPAPGPDSSDNRSSAYASAPPSKTKWGDDVRNNRHGFARNIRSDERNIREGARPLAFSLTNLELRARSSLAMREFAGTGANAAKALAEALECSEKTAKNYLDGRNHPGGIHDARAMAAIPSYAAMKLEISAVRTNVDQRVLALLDELTREVSGMTLSKERNRRS